MIENLTNLNSSEKKLTLDINNIWSLLKKEKSESLVYRRVRELDYGCFMGYWADGIKGPALIINFLGGLTLNSKDFKNISVTQRVVSHNKSRLIIQPKLSKHFKVFEKYMPLFFMNKSKDLFNSSQLNKILTEIKEFSKMITLNKTNMSKEQIKGLFGELLFMKDLIISKKYTNLDILEAWQKNGNKSNDFVFTDREIEIKTSEDLEQKIVHISSEYQLFSLNRLKVNLFFKGIKKSKDAISLDELIIEIKKKLNNDKQNLLLFSKKLLTYGFFSCSMSKNLRYREMFTEQFDVNNNFPKLTVDNIPRGVFEVKYKIKLPKNRH